MYTKQVFVDDSGALWSLTAHPSMGQLAHSWVVEYSIDEWAVPRQEGSLLFVEKTDCTMGTGPQRSVDKCVETWECEVRGVTGQCILLHPCYVNSKTMLADFWRKAENRRRFGFAKNTLGLSHTQRLVEGVKLVRRI